jgi:aspartyl-tRNA synthetase
METALDFLGDLRRTHACGQLRASDAGSRAVLMGWVHRHRDLGGVIFIHLRDRYGVTQIVFHAEVGEAVYRKAEQVRPEYVIAIEGQVALRSPDTVNPSLETAKSSSWRKRSGCSTNPVRRLFPWKRPWTWAKTFG